MKGSETPDLFSLEVWTGFFISFHSWCSATDPHHWPPRQAQLTVLALWRTSLRTPGIKSRIIQPIIAFIFKVSRLRYGSGLIFFRQGCRILDLTASFYPSRPEAWCSASPPLAILVPRCFDDFNIQSIWGSRWWCNGTQFGNWVANELVTCSYLFISCRSKSK